MEVQTRQEASAAARRTLADKTKAFRKLDEAGRNREWGALLREYQVEIDALTRRARAGEKAFLSVGGAAASAVTAPSH